MKFYFTFGLTLNSAISQDEEDQPVKILEIKVLYNRETAACVLFVVIQ